jgi:hypothetical protein
MANTPYDSSRIAEVVEIANDYPEAIRKKYGQAAADYVGETESEISIPEAEFLRDNPAFATTFMELYLTSEEADGKTMQEYAEILLRQNEKEVDTAQMSLFDTNDENLDGADNSNPCKQ